MSKVTAHLEGLVRLFNLPPRSAEKAVLEAVVNSVQATEDRFGDETAARGRVEVAILVETRDWVCGGNLRRDVGAGCVVP